MEGPLALFYGVLLAWSGWNGYQARGNRFSLIGGGALGGLAGLGGLLLTFTGSATGRGIALLAVSLATLYFGWVLSQAIREERPAARVALTVAGSAVVLAFLIQGAGA